MKNIKFVFTLFLFLFSLTFTSYADLPTGQQYSSDFTDEDSLEIAPEDAEIIETKLAESVYRAHPSFRFQYSTQYISGGYSSNNSWWKANGKDYEYNTVPRTTIYNGSGGTPLECATFNSQNEAGCFFCSSANNIKQLVIIDATDSASNTATNVLVYNHADNMDYGGIGNAQTFRDRTWGCVGDASNIDGTIFAELTFDSGEKHRPLTGLKNSFPGYNTINRQFGGLFGLNWGFSYPINIPVSWYIYYIDNTGIYNPIQASKIACLHENYEYRYTDYNTHGTFCADCGKYLEIEESHDFTSGGLNADGICEYGYANNECKCGCNKTIHLSIERYDHKDEYKDKIVFVGHLATPSEAINYSALPKGYRYTDINKESKDLPTHFGYKHETLDGRLIPIYYYMDYEYNSDSFGNLLQYRVSTGSNAEKYYYDVEYESPYFAIPSPNAHLSWKIASVSNASYNDLNFVEIITKKPFSNLINIHEAKLYLIPNIAIPSSKGSGSSRGGSGGGGGGGGGSSDNSLPQNNKNDSNYDSFHNKLVDFDLLSIFTDLKNTFNVSINTVKSALSDFSEELKRIFSLNEKIQIIAKTTLNKEKSKEPSKKGVEKSKVNLSSGISDSRQKSLNEQIAILTKATLNKEKGRSD